MVEELGLPYTSSQRERSSIRIFSTPSSEAILFIVDNEKFLRIEEKDTGTCTPTSTHVSDAINLAIYSFYFFQSVSLSRRYRYGGRKQ
jgi:hypothetical protein